MSFFGTGNRTVNSTGLGDVTSNPTTGTLIAEIDCNSTQATIRRGGEPWQVTWIVGAQTTLATFRLEQTLSTGLDMSTAGRDLTLVMVSSGQSAQYITKHNVEPGDRFRVRVNSSFQGAVVAKIIGEPMV
jgi:hypothetical protein